MEAAMLMRRSSAIALTLLFGASVVVAAQTEAKRIAPDEYTGTTANMTPGAGTKLSIKVLQWSAEGDRERVLSVLRSASKEQGSQSDLEKTLDGVPTVGYIWTSGSLGYSLKYAHRLTLPDGGERVVVMTDRPLGSWDRPAWKANGQHASTDGPFTVVELHLNSKGKGDGKMSLAAPVTVDESTKTVGLANYETAAVLLEDVKHEPKPYWAREG